MARVDVVAFIMEALHVPEAATGLTDELCLACMMPACLYQTDSQMISEHEIVNRQSVCMYMMLQHTEAACGVGMMLQHTEAA